jgi:hypothetical protein
MRSDIAFRAPALTPSEGGVLVRYALLTYNPPGGREIWAAMTESERRRKRKSTFVS